MRPELIVGIAVVVAVYLVVELVMRRLQLRRRRALGERWGRPPEDRRLTPEQARRLHDLLGPSEDPAVWTLDDRSWSDLDLDTLHARLDHTLTPVGSQLLYRLLRTLVLEEAPLVRRRQQLDRLRSEPELRERLQLSLLNARDRDLAMLAETLWSQPPVRAWWERLVPVLFVAPFIAALAAFLGVVSWAPAIGAIIVNVGVHVLHTLRVEALPLRQLGALLGAAAGLATSAGDLAPETTAAMLPGLERTVRARRRLPVMQLEDGVGLSQYLRVVLLLDVVAWCTAAAVMRSAAEELRRVLLAVGEIDTLVALASWSDSTERLSVPEVLPSLAGACVEELRHPLLADPVPCSLRFERAGVLVTGSNMSGKTTFLKSVGSNAVLAQTLGLVCAKRWRMPMLRPVTAIGRADNLIEGRSYYLAEVEAVARLVRAAETTGTHLFLADELFRGTNAVERIAGAAAVLRHLAGHGHLVLAATHDLELAELLGDAYLSLHFSEELDEAGLRFDYRLKAGVTTGRTAIALLEHAGYPEGVVNEARRLVEQLDRPDRGVRQGENQPTNRRHI